MKKYKNLREYCIQNDMEHLLDEWDYIKNGEYTPNNVLPFSNKKRHWICKNGHKWFTSVNNRAKGRGCKICNSDKYNSRIQIAIAYYLGKVFEIEQSKNFSWLGQQSLDIYIPSLNLAIEYDGERWHQNIVRDQKKDNLCIKNNLDLVRLRELGCPKYKSCAKIIELKKRLYSYYDCEYIISKLLAYINLYYNLNITIDVNPKRDSIDILNFISHSIKANSLEAKHPNIAAEWDYEKNGKLKPSEVNSGSSIRVYWLCSKGHSYLAAISNRTNKDNLTGCPYCENKKILVGYNDLATTHPHLAAEWDYNKNTKKPTEVLAGNAKNSFYWLCSKGHSWKCRIYSRAYKGENCTICSGRKILVGYNDLATTHPHLAAQWDYSKNKFLPTEVSYGSNKMAYFICERGHEWHGKINSITNKNSGCKYCVNQGVIEGDNDLATTHPFILNWWDYKKNTVSPTAITYGYSKKVYFKCKCGYSWSGYITNALKTKYSSICKKCNRKEINHLNNLTYKENNLLITHPEIAAEWDYEKNGEYRPEFFTYASNVVVNWKCKKGHCWKISISSRTTKKNNCPYCYSTKAKKGYNDLVTTNPDVASEWDYEKNGNKKPENYKNTSYYQIWWKCKKGHSVKESIRARVAHGCKKCK